MARTRYIAIWLLGLALFASACSALTPDNPAATLQAQRQGFVVEATSIAQAAQVQSTQVMGTAVAAQTYVAQMEGRNRLLLATMQVVFPPTQALVVNDGPSTPGQVATTAPVEAFGETTLAPVDEGSAADSPGSARFTQVGTASSVREADDCAESLVSAFPADVQKIFITTRGLNVAQGTEMRAEWYYQEQLIYTESYTIPRDDDDFCMWLSIAPTDVALSPGNWSVRLFANNQPVDPPEVNFTVG